MAFEVFLLSFSKLTRFSIIRLPYRDKQNPVRSFTAPPPLLPLFFLDLEQRIRRHYFPLFLSRMFSTETPEERGGGAARCSILELLQTCWPSLTEDCVASHTSLSQQLNQVLQSLREALALPGTDLPAWEQSRGLSEGDETAKDL